MNRLPIFRSDDAQDRVMTVHDLPARVKRWTPNLKATFVRAVCAGALTVECMERRYDIPADEFWSWWRHYEARGLRGLTRHGLEAARRGGAA
jgi:transposase-like protein